MASRETTGWRPIETAPTDQRILIFGGYPDRERFIALGTYNSDVRWEYRFVGEGMHTSAGYQATHWMPLPEPPDA